MALSFGIIFLAVCILFSLRYSFAMPSLFAATYSSICLIIYGSLIFSGAEARNILFSAMPLRDIEKSENLTLVFYSGLIITCLFITLGVKSNRHNKFLQVLSETIWRKRTFLSSGYMFVFLIFWSLLLLCHAFDLDWDTVFRNYSYQSIKNPDMAGIDTLFGRLFHFLFRPLGVFISILMIIFLSTGYFIYFIISFFIGAYSFIILLADSSRWAPLYLFTMFLASGVIQGRWLTIRNTFLLVGMFLAFLTVLTGRSEQLHGVTRIDDNLQKAIFYRPGDAAIGFFVNTMEGAINFANAVVIDADHPTEYKVLALSPLVSAIDGYARIRDEAQVRISPVVPMGSFGEIWHFGPVYLIIYFAVYFLFLRLSNIILSRGEPVSGFFFLTLSTYVTLIAPSYSTRTSFRFMFYGLLIGLALYFLRKNPRRGKAIYRSRFN